MAKSVLDTIEAALSAYGKTLLDEVRAKEELLGVDLQAGILELKAAEADLVAKAHQLKAIDDAQTARQAEQDARETKLNEIKAALQTPAG